MSLNLRRILAYIFDILAISLLAGFLARSPLNPNYAKSESLQEEYAEITEEYQDKFDEQETDEDKEAVLEEFRNVSKNYSSRASKLAIYNQVISISCIVLYGSVLAYFLGGQTVGKKLMKIRVVNKNGTKTSFLKLLVRVVFIYEVPFKILTLIFAYAFDQNVFYTAYNVIYYLNMVLSVTIICTALGRSDRRGLHDLVMGTKVEIDGDGVPEANVDVKEK